jgi:hypothetical protein
MTISTLLDDMKNRPPISRLRERDIDLLICSELHFPESPLHRLFLGGWKGGVAEFAGAWVSVSYPGSDGETDILVSYESGPKSLVLLIEDKIDAEYQPDQPERYQTRAELWRKEMPPGSDVETILLAPEDYFETQGSEIFDRQVSYEEVVEVLAESTDVRTGFLARALQEGRRSLTQSYVGLHSDSTTAVWDAIWEMANSATPQLRMKSPGSKPARAGFIYFTSAEGVSSSETGRRAHIVYKPAHGNADLQFANMREEALRNSVGHVLGADMIVEQAAKAASIRIKVPVVDFGRAPEEQGDAIGQGLLASERLRQFFIENRLLELVPSA